MSPSRLLNSQRSLVSEIWTLLEQADTVLIGTHEHPDGDALGASLALMRALNSLGKQVTVYIPDPAPDVFSFLPGFDQLTTVKPSRLDTFSAIALLDYTKVERTHLASAQYHPRSISIDHHYENPRELAFNLVVPQAAATAQILYELFKSVQVPITKDIATCLLTGIFTDSGSFMHDSTTPEILNIASDLMNRGARLSHIAHETYQKKELSSLRLWGKALSRVMVNEKNGAAVSVITYQDLRDCRATLDDLSGVVNMLNTLPQIKFAMMLCEYEPGKIKGSLRSEPHKATDVSQIAKRLGGGGHRLASGFEISGHIVKQNNQWRVTAP